MTAFTASFLCFSHSLFTARGHTTRKADYDMFFLRVLPVPPSRFRPLNKASAKTRLFLSSLYDSISFSLLTHSRFLQFEPRFRVSLHCIDLRLSRATTRPLSIRTTCTTHACSHSTRSSSKMRRLRCVRPSRVLALCYFISACFLSSTVLFPRHRCKSKEHHCKQSRGA